MSESLSSVQSSDKLDIRVNNLKSAQLPNQLSSKISLPRTVNKVHSIASIVCRICHTNTVNEGLISPCNCKGTLAYVHLSCLERWLNESSRNYCELCMYRYTAIATKRYKLCEGIRLWIRHPRNRSHVRSDLLIAVLLSLVTFGLIASCVLGMEYFVTEASKLGVQRKWIKSGICTFLIIVVLGYMATMYLIGRDQFAPWFRWWNTTVDIHLSLPSEMECRSKCGARAIHV